MAKGSAAKEVVIEKIKNAFGENFAGIDDKKKIYVWADDGGEKVQIAIALTCPKTNIDFNNSPVVSANNVMNFEAPVETPPKMSEDEQATLNRLMEELGL